MKLLLLLLAIVFGGLYIMLYPKYAHWFDYQYYTLSGNTYPWYWKDGSFRIYWVKWVEQVIIFNKQKTEITSCKTDKVCKVNQDTRNSIINLLLTADYQCLDLQRLSTLVSELNQYEEKQNCTKKITEKETPIIIPVQQYRETPRTGAWQ